MCISSGYYLQKKRNEMKTKKSKDTTPESMLASPTVFILCVKLACFIIFNLLYNIYIRYFLKHRPHAHIWHSSLFSVSSILTWYYAPWLARISTVHTSVRLSEKACTLNWIVFSISDVDSILYRRTARASNFSFFMRPLCFRTALISALLISAPTPCVLHTGLAAVLMEHCTDMYF